MADVGNLKVLVVDDESTFADSLAKLLKKRFKARVETVDCADAARQRMAEGFDIITLDYQMPDCDGLTFLKEINENTVSPPVIMVTGHGAEQTAIDAFRLGASGYVVKDQRMPEMLANAVEKALQDKQLTETQEALAASERDYRNLVETANSIILKVDNNGNLTYMNDFGLRFFGFNWDELKGKNVIGTILGKVESTGRDLEKMAADILTDPDGYAVNENEHVKKNGENVWVAWSNRSIRDDEGSVVGTLSIGNDITEYKKAQEAFLKQSEESRRLSEMIDWVSDSIFTLDSDWKLNYWSKASEKIYGYRSEEVLGRDPKEVLHTEYPSGQDRDLAKREMESRGLFRVILTQYRKDGTKLAMDTTNWYARDREGNITGVISVSRELTEEKQAEETIRWQRDILDEVGEAIIVTDATEDYHITLWNEGARRMYGWSSEEVLGRPILSIITLGREEQATEGVLEDIQGKGHFEGVIDRYRRDGSLIKIDSHSTAQRNDAGEIIGYVMVHRDVTERVKQQEKIREQAMVLDNVSDAIFAVDLTHRAETRIISWNKEAEKLFGFSAEEAIGQPSSILRRPERLFDRNEKIRELTETGGGTFDSEFRSYDGRQLLVEVTSRATYLPTGEPQTLINIIHDVTQKRIDEKRLREQADVLDQVSDAVLLLDASKGDLTPVIGWNRGAEELFGIPAAEAIGRSTGDLLDIKYNVSRAEVLEILRERDQMEYEGSFLAPDGRETELEFRTVTLRDANGAPYRFVTTVRDETERTDTQRRLEWQAQILSNILEPVISIDTEGMVKSWNPGAERLYGFSMEEAIGTNLEELLRPDFAEGDSFVKLRERVESSGHLKFETRNRSKDGRLIMVESSAWPTTDESGMRTGYVSIHRDMTERYEAESKLREQTDLLDSVSDMIIIQDVTRAPETRITYWSRGAELITGFSAEEAVGRNSLDLLKPEYDFQRDEQIREIVEKGSSRYEGVFHTKDNRGIVVDVNVQAKYDHSGKPEKFFSIIRDITDRKKAEEELRQTTEYLENLFGYANAPIIVWDTSFKITRFSRAFEKMTGYTADDVVGKDLGMLFPEDSREASLDEIKRTSAGEQWESVEIPILQKDGDVCTALWNSANVYDTDGSTMLATIAQGQDITERKKAEEELKHLNDELDGYAHLVSHDLKSPLSAINLANSLLREDITDIRNEQVRRELEDSVDTIGKSLTRAYSLISGLLALAEAGRSPVEVESVSVADVVRDVLEERAGLVQEKGAKVDVEGDFGTITANALQIYQVFNNIIGNALLHNDSPNPRVTIRSKGINESGSRRFEVHDNGLGIAPEDLTEIFRPFYKHGSGTDTGIGLSIAHKIIETYGGEIRAYNDNGACFEFTLRDWVSESAS